MVVYQFASVVFGVSSSPFLLNATVRYHLEQHSEAQSDLVSKVLRSIYVDDIVTGSESEEKTYDLYTGAKALLKIGAFNLCKFSTNSSTVLIVRSQPISRIHLNPVKKLKRFHKLHWVEAKNYVLVSKIFWALIGMSLVTQ